MKPANLIDIHCHIIPYVDDGAQNTEEALALLQLQVEQGVSTVFCTPHLRQKMFETPQQKIDEQLQKLQAAARQIPGAPTLLPGREHHVDEQFFNLLESGGLTPLAGGPYVLVEFGSAHTAEQMLQAVRRVQLTGLIPVVAHVERYPAVRRDKQLPAALLAQGARLQVNAETLLGKAGLRQQLFGMGLVREGLVQLVASDAHRVGLRPPLLGDCAARLYKKLPNRQWNTIFYENPAMLCEGITMEV